MALLLEIASLNNCVYFKFVCETSSTESADLEVAVKSEPSINFNWDRYRWLESATIFTFGETLEDGSGLLELTKLGYAAINIVNKCNII